MKYTHVYIKVRHVSRSYKPSYEAKIIRRREAGFWDTLATTRNHATKEAAVKAILKLADRRGIEVTNDARALRVVEFKDRYGDDY